MPANSRGIDAHSNEERYRALLAALSTFTWVADASGEFAAPQPGWEQYTGQDFERHRGWGWIDVVHPDDRAYVSDAWRHAVSSKSWYEVEWRCWHSATQTWRRCRTRGAPVLNPDGSVREWVAAVRDVESDLDMERVFRREWLRHAQASAGLALWDYDLRRDQGSWTIEAHALYNAPIGTSYQELDDYIHPEDRERVAAARAAIVSSGTLDITFRIVRPCGEIRWLRSRGAKVPGGSGSHIAGALIDVTELMCLQQELRSHVTELMCLHQELRSQEGQLRESEERFRNMADSAPLMIWTAGCNTDCTFVNKSWLAFTGRTIEEELGDGWISNVHPDDLEGCLATYQAAFSERRTIQLEYRKRHANGEYRWVLGHGVPRLGTDGRFMGYVGTCTDITDLKRSRDEEITRQRLESVGTLASGIAHDFNNLLGAVVAQAELALAELDEGSNPKGELGAIRDVAMRGSEIVRELMIYAGRESEVRGLVDVSQVVEQMLELLKVSVSKHATLKTNLGEHLPAIRATAAQVSQLVMNLATNASEAIVDRDGMILVTTRRVMVGHGSREIERLAEGEYVQLEVSDTGCGMPPETRAKVFDPFFSTKSAGRGLGLAVVYGVVRDLGGTINLTSEPGHGTTFQILLPCAESTSETMPATISETAQPVRTSQEATVLIVEDEDRMREAVSKMLDRHGFSVIQARDGSAALDAIREQNNPIHVLFLDITLPGASCREVLQEARRLRPAMRVIVTSAYTQEMAGASLQSTTELFIRKPYRLDDLLHLIRPGLSEPLAARHSDD